MTTNSTHKSQGELVAYPQILKWMSVWFPLREEEEKQHSCCHFLHRLSQKVKGKRSHPQALITQSNHPFMRQWYQIAVCIYKSLLQYTGDCFQTDLVKVYKSWGKPGLQLQLKMLNSSTCQSSYLSGKVQIFPKRQNFKIAELNFFKTVTWMNHLWSHKVEVTNKNMLSLFFNNYFHQKI